MIGGVDPASPHFHGGWLAGHRNVTFHYPEMHPEKSAYGKEEITEALKKAAELEGTITLGSTRGDLRFGFADEVAVQWLPDADQPLVFVQLQQAVIALAAFAQHASRAYLSSRPAGTVSVQY